MKKEINRKKQEESKKMNFKNHKKRNTWKKIALSFLLLGIMINFNSTFARGDAAPGDIAVWEIGEGNNIITSYMKATINSIDNESKIYIDIELYDILGDHEPDKSSTNFSMPLFWRSVEDVVEMKTDGNDLTDVTVAGKTVECVILDIVSGSYTKSYCYDLNTGIMVKWIDTEDNFQRLIGWGDMDVKSYADEQNRGIAGYSGFLLSVISISIISSILVFNRKKKVGFTYLNK